MVNEKLDHLRVPGFSSCSECCEAFAISNIGMRYYRQRSGLWSFDNFQAKPPTHDTQLILVRASMIKKQLGMICQHDARLKNSD